MIDEQHWNFIGDGWEIGPETRIRPNPGWHYYEHSKSRIQRLEELIGIRMTTEHDAIAASEIESQL